MTYAAASCRWNAWHNKRHTASSCSNTDIKRHRAVSGQRVDGYGAITGCVTDMNDGLADAAKSACVASRYHAAHKNVVLRL